MDVREPRASDRARGAEDSQSYNPHVGVFPGKTPRGQVPRNNLRQGFLLEKPHVTWGFFWKSPPRGRVPQTSPVPCCCCWYRRDLRNTTTWTFPEKTDVTLVFSRKPPGESYFVEPDHVGIFLEKNPRHVGFFSRENPHVVKVVPRNLTTWVFSLEKPT